MSINWIYILSSFETHALNCELYFLAQSNNELFYFIIITDPPINVSQAHEIMGNETGFADVNLVRRALTLHVNLTKQMFSQSIIMIGLLWFSICPRLFQVAALQKINCIWLVNIMDSNYKHTI